MTHELPNVTVKYEYTRLIQTYIKNVRYNTGFDNILNGLRWYDKALWQLAEKSSYLTDLWVVGRWGGCCVWRWRVGWDASALCHSSCCAHCSGGDARSLTQCAPARPEEPSACCGLREWCGSASWSDCKSLTYHSSSRIVEVIFHWIDYRALYIWICI